MMSMMNSSQALKEDSSWGAEDSEEPPEYNKMKIKNTYFGEVTYVPPEDPVKNEREGWTNKWDFLFCCLNVSVGLGNVWRFPYLCYKNGGGAFLITYGIAMVTCGIPLFFQEIAVGQYLGSGGLNLVGQLAPLFKGVGFAAMTIVFFLDIYYCVIISWTLYYIISAFVAMPDIPWRYCGNVWNTENCSSVIDNSQLLLPNSSKSTTPVEEFFERNVLGITGGIEEMGGIQWKLLVCLIIGWILVYIIIRNGLHQSGKIIWFTALFPYVVLFILLIRAVTLNGALDGISQLFIPRWEELLKPEPWLEGATQIFFAYNIGCAALPVLGSYNSFHHNFYKDAFITCIVNTLTSIVAGIVTFSILGYLALEKGTSVSEVVTSGPGLVFLTYPEVVLKLPWSAFWTLLFFFMLLVLGLDCAFCLVEAFIAGALDNWAETLRPHKERFRLVVCFVMFLLGIPMIMNGGMYVFQIMDYYSASGMSLLWVCLFQTIAISWVFGTKRLSDCVEQMLGFRPGFYWTICWQICAPFVMIVIFVAQCFQFQPLTYGDSYEYPWWAKIIGFGLSLLSMMWIPLYAIYYLIRTPGTIWENLRDGLKPNIKQRKLSVRDKENILISESTIVDF